MFNNSLSTEKHKLAIALGPHAGRKAITLRKVEPDYIDNFSSDEENVALRSEACATRCDSHIPAPKKTNNCDGCAYYRALQGQFYFWDYGLCSNPESTRDGKVVNVKSNCKKLNRDLKAT